MNQINTGMLIKTLRLEHGMTQKDLAELLQVSDKAVSKWERGLGLPDPSLLSRLAEILETETGLLLSGELEKNKKNVGNMKALNFYVCPHCGNLITSADRVSAYCCGKKLKNIKPEKAAPEEKLSVEIIERDYFITSAHPMTKEHHISFVALLTGDSIMLRRQYPEWDLQARIPCFAHGMLLWYCSRCGLKYQYI